jgi:hypothetical protein
MVIKYVKKPVIIEALKYDGTNFVEIQNFCMPSEYQNATSCAEMRRVSDEHFALYISTLEGEHIASIGDYIIKGIKGEFYPCKPDIFTASYDAVS